ncbi:MAG: hypothetical protein ACXADL_05585 [Candidatus Thorarchaeota archaeon]
MRRLSILVLALLFLLVVPTQQHSLVSAHITPIAVSQADTADIERDWSIHFVLVNYDQELIDEAVLMNGLPTERFHSASPTYITYNIDYDITYANETYTNDIRQVLLESSVNGSDTGSQLDEAALEYHKNNLDDPQTIFHDRDGRRIDGYNVEDWLIANPAVEPPGLGYVFYLFNFSEFDTPGHELEHWYDYHPIDPDSGEDQNWFRLEWDNALNPDVKFEFPGFGGRGNIYVLDPSADQWYLRWARIWWNNPPYSNVPEHCTMDLEDKANTLDLGTPSGINALNMYLSNYIFEPVSFLLIPFQHDPTAYVESGLLRGIVFGMDVATGVSIDSLRWVTDAEMQKAHLEDLLPFIPWSAHIDFWDIDDYPEWSQLFWNNASVVDGVTQVDGYGMFNAIYEQMRPHYVDIDDENINVFGTVFIKKQMEMYAQGRTFTGLGGGGQTCIWKSWERYYRPDGVTPKDGISAVQLHETMHAVGIGHTWGHPYYAGDFSFSPMGYFGKHNGTATFDKNWVQSTYLDQMEGDLWMLFTERRQGIGSQSRPQTILAEEKVLTHFERSRAFYNQMDWIGCFDELNVVEEWIERLRLSRIDAAPPIIENWGVGDNIFAGNTTVWAQVTDNLAGIENVSAHVRFSGSELVYLCEFDGTNWTVEFEQLPVDVRIEIWIEAWDWGVNNATSESLYFGADYPEYNPFLDPFVIGAISISAAGIIVIVSALWLRKRRSR